MRTVLRDLRGIRQGWAIMMMVVASWCLIAPDSFAAESISEDLSSRFSGKIVDQNNAAVAGARVIAVRAGTGIKSDTVTDGDGVFTFELPRGQYVVTIAAKGFEEYSDNVDLRDSDQFLNSIVLKVESAAATVTVSDEAIYLTSDTQSATKTFTPLRDV